MISLRKWLHGSDALKASCVRRDKAVKEYTEATHLVQDASLNNLEQSVKAYDAAAELLHRMEKRR